MQGAVNTALKDHPEKSSSSSATAWERRRSRPPATTRASPSPWTSTGTEWATGQKTIDAGLAGPSQQHTGTVVPGWAGGPGSLDVLGTNDHTDLFRTLGG